MQYFIAMDDEVYGPYSYDGLSALGILPDTLICTDQPDSSWKQARLYPELQSLIQSTNEDVEDEVDDDDTIDDDGVSSYSQHPYPYNSTSTRSTETSSALGIVALIASLVSVGLLVFSAVRIMQWGIFGLAGRSSMIITAGVISVIAYILAKIAENSQEEESSVVNIAEWLSGTCIFVIVAFYLYLRFGDPNMLNPFKIK